MIPQDPKHPNCSLCSRAAITKDSYCIMHAAALSSLRERFPDWQRAIGDISWERYLETILTVEETGDWVKQVAKNELSKRAGQNLKTL